jgi:hypothetical protein
MARINKSLPVGTAVFPKLDKVDVYQPVDQFGKPKGDPKRTWNTQIKFSDEDHREVDALLKQWVADAGLKSVANWPWKTSKKTGEVTLKVESKEAKKPGMYDSQNGPLPAGTVITGGSQIKVNVQPYVYTGLGGGIKLYLNAVQVMELAQGAGVSPFEAVEGGYVAPKETSEDKSPFDPSEANTDDEEAF